MNKNKYSVLYNSNIIIIIYYKYYTKINKYNIIYASCLGSLLVTFNYIGSYINQSYVVSAGEKVNGRFCVSYDRYVFQCIAEIQ